MRIGFHTDAFNSADFGFEKALLWAQEHDGHCCEPGVIERVSWIHGLGHFAHVSLTEDPLLLLRAMERHGVIFSQVDAVCSLFG